MEVGQPYELFWRLTLKEIGIILDAEANRLKREYNDRMSLAWHTAHLTAYAPQKSSKFQKLKTLLIGGNKPKRQQTPEELEAITRSWLASRHRKKRS